MGEGAGTWNRNGGNAMKRFTMALVLITWAGVSLDSTWKNRFEPEPEIGYIGGEYDAYQDTQESDSDIVVVVEFLPPSWTEADTRRIPLKRNANSKNKRIYVSYGWAACGGGGSYGGNLTVRNHGPDTREIEVSVSVSWKNESEPRGFFEHEMVVPWNRDVKQTIDSRSWTRVRFERPRRESKSLDQCDLQGIHLRDSSCDQQ
jgi:hypothetical protein